MNDLRESTEYKEAITVTTQGWTDIGIGFTEKETPQSISILSRQLNTLLYFVIQLRKEVAHLKREIANQPPTVDLTALTEQLEKTHLSSQGASFKRNQGKIKVFKNPFDLLKEIK